MKQEQTILGICFEFIILLMGIMLISLLIVISLVLVLLPLILGVMLPPLYGGLTLFFGYMSYFVIARRTGYLERMNF
jgi:hypothetical protein